MGNRSGLGTIRARERGVRDLLALVFATLTAMGPELWIPVAARAGNPSGPVVATINGIQEQGLTRQDFALSGTTPLWVRAEGAGDSRGTAFIAQGWILDLQTRKPVWTMAGAEGSRDRKTDNWVSSGAVTLPAGVYAVYFAACGGTVPLNDLIRLFGLSIGHIEGNWGPTLKWNERGKPARWGITVQAMNAGYAPAPLPAQSPLPYPDAIVRLLGLPDKVVKRVRLDLLRTARIQVAFTGEYSRQGKGFSDVAWISQLSDFRRIWQPDYDASRPAGGDDKNRSLDETITLRPGSYLLTAATDASHAVGDWNAEPPWDPDAWGVAVSLPPDQDRAAVHVALDYSLPDPVLAIQRVGDNACIRKPFTVSRPARALVRCYGELGNEGGYADFGWIERTKDMTQVWSMVDTTAGYGGGAKKNRLLETILQLSPGSYNLCYATDDSHSYNNWNMEPPWEPDDWGISLAEIGEGKGGAVQFASVSPDHGAIHPGAPAGGPLVLTLAPARSDEERIKRFDVVDPVQVMLIAVGEGEDGEMMDYGWLSNDGTGEKVWEMTYDKTSPAGGAAKNREVQVRLRLPKGSYSLHFVTDDSHAFGDWNAAPPDEPQLWGITLVEQGP